MTLDWSPAAISDFDEITDYLFQEYRSLAGKEQAKLILAAVHQLTEFPYSGRKGEIAGTYEKVCNGTPFLASYTVSGEVVRILRVYHGRRKLPLSSRTPRARAH